MADRADKHAEVLQSFLDLKMRRFVSERSEQPLLEMFFSDATPYTVQSRHAVEADGLTARREGRECKDFLMQRTFVVSVDGQVRTYFRDARMMSDKHHLTSYRGFADEWHGVRRMGAKDIVISCYVFDRAVQSAMERRMRQQHGLQELYLLETEPDTAAETILKSWVVSLGCSCHDLHGGLKWSVMQYVGSKQMMKDSWVIFQSLRQSSEQIWRNLHAWVAEHILYENYDGPDLTPLYQLFRIEVSWLPRFVELQMRWENGRLKVAASWEGNPMGLLPVVSALMYLWKFPRWAESRWCSIGYSCARGMAGLYTGIHSMVDRLLTDGVESSYFVSGFKRLSSSIRRFWCVTTCVACVSERALQIVLKDDRLALICDEVLDTMAVQAERVLKMPAHVIEICASLGEISVTQLLGENAQCVQTQLAYVRLRLKEAMGLPWTLCRGDIVRNLQYFRDESRPLAEELPQRIHDLLTGGENIHLVTKGIQLLANISWSTKCVEDPHSAGARLMRLHNTYGQETLLARMFIKNAAPMFHKCKEERVVDRISLLVEKEKKRKFQHITGRQAFCSALVHGMRDKQGREHNVKHYSRAVVKVHSKRWKMKTRAEKEMYESEATALADVKRDASRQKMKDLRSRLSAAKEALKQSVTTGTSYTKVGRCRFSKEEILDYDKYFQEPMWTQGHIEDLRRKHTAPVGHPLQAEVASLDLIEVPKKPSYGKNPEWIPWCAANREEFKHIIMETKRRNDIAYYKFAFAKLNPVFAAFHLVTPVDVPEKEFRAGRWEDELEISEHMFELKLDKTYYSDDRFLEHVTRIRFLDDVLMKGSRLYCSDSEWKTLEEMRELLPISKKPQRAGPRKMRSWSTRPCSRKSGWRTRTCGSS